MSSKRAVRYMQVDPKSIPAGVRFDIPGRNGGQMIEVAYGDFSRSEHGWGDRWRRVRNLSVGSDTRYYRLVDAATGSPIDPVFPSQAVEVQS